MGKLYEVTPVSDTLTKYSPDTPVRAPGNRINEIRSSPRAAELAFSVSAKRLKKS